MDKALNPWEMLNKPVPLYTEQNVQDTAEYAKQHPERYTEIYLTALKFVQAALRRELPGSVTVIHDVRLIAAAIESARDTHDKSVQAKDFVGATRWRYIMTATKDYLNAIKRHGG